MSVSMNDFSYFHGVLWSIDFGSSFKDLYGVYFSISVEVESLNHSGEILFISEMLKSIGSELGER